MNTSNQHGFEAVDLSEYACRILAIEDHPIFDEAVSAAKTGALRAAYVMIWLACAESLKRRFNVASTRDNAAAKIAGQIVVLEKQHKAVDKVLLDKAKDYGFVSDSGYQSLFPIYEMRCIYRHPYEKGPSVEAVKDAAATVIENVLSKPVKLRHGFGNQLIRSLLEERSFLDDQEAAVADFAKRILPSLDETVHVWLLDRYWEKLEELSGDPTMATFFRRGIWFVHTVIAQLGSEILSEEEWHHRVRMFPRILTRVLTTAELFERIGELAQNTVVGSALEESETRASVLTHLERLSNQNVLSERQQDRFTECVSGLGITEMRASELGTKTCFQKLIEAMKSHDWYTQNPAIDLVVSNGPDQAAGLTEDQQVNLGRNLLQAGDGGARSATAFLEKLTQGLTSWPFHVVRGIALEPFTNEDYELRPKDRRLGLVLSALLRLDEAPRDRLISETAASVDGSTAKYWRTRDSFGPTLDLLNAHEWAKLLVRSLEAKLQAEAD